MTAAVLALQGAFAEHEKKLEQRGVAGIELRNRADLRQAFDCLILPGGESTVQGKLLREQEMLEPLRERILDGMPVLATCAGAILLASEIEHERGNWFGTMPMTIRRNVYGRQLGSFHAEAPFAGGPEVPLTFIRAPLITRVGEGAEVLLTVGGQPAAVRFRNQIAVSFHPELDDDMTVYDYFLSAAAG